MGGRARNGEPKLHKEINRLFDSLTIGSSTRQGDAQCASHPDSFQQSCWNTEIDEIPEMSLQHLLPQPQIWPWGHRASPQCPATLQVDLLQSWQNTWMSDNHTSPGCRSSLKAFPVFLQQHMTFFFLLLNLPLLSLECPISFCPKFLQSSPCWKNLTSKQHGC